ncbi:Hypothetical_protein [Hexamita inflata]|uniref:Hypothetical_protein n=1 Tax=Hexamita inflata TaxID=28002 RepID=A0AA86NPZ6_9EUKA|nr:Hypothetical protein HINF_LOCUS10733 [Hexamita inflata]
MRPTLQYTTNQLYQILQTQPESLVPLQNILSKLLESEQQFIQHASKLDLEQYSLEYRIKESARNNALESKRIKRVLKSVEMGEFLSKQLEVQPSSVTWEEEVVDEAAIRKQLELELGIEIKESEEKIQLKLELQQFDERLNEAETKMQNTGLNQLKNELDTLLSTKTKLNGAQITFLLMQNNAQLQKAPPVNSNWKQIQIEEQNIIFNIQVQINDLRQKVYQVQQEILNKQRTLAYIKNKCNGLKLHLRELQKKQRDKEAELQRELQKTNFRTARKVTRVQKPWRESNPDQIEFEHFQKQILEMKKQIDFLQKRKYQHLTAKNVLQFEAKNGAQEIFQNENVFECLMFLAATETERSNVFITQTE